MMVFWDFYKKKKEIQFYLNRSENNKILTKLRILKLRGNKLY